MESALVYFRFFLKGSGVTTSSFSNLEGLLFKPSSISYLGFSEMVLMILFIKSKLRTSFSHKMLHDQIIILNSRKAI